MPEDGTLFLIDPFFDRTFRGLSAAKMAAQRAVRSVAQARVEWIEKFSHEAVQDWTAEIDFLFLDGDHSYEGVRQDWLDWTPHVAADGLVALHDAHPDGPWTEPHHGPVRFFAELREDAGWQLVDYADTLVVLRRA
jgi:predicted O-methyltransferase YrrM